jgi:hypothetical protein
MGETLKNSGMKFLFFPQFFHLNGFIKGGKKIRLSELLLKVVRTQAPAAMTRFIAFPLLSQPSKRLI